ncbi:hypothetical protein C0991_010015 [Blastosporella zonata]|nr:hypothetical protein C0991_010015 [Blastosporella zonata]
MSETVWYQPGYGSTYSTSEKIPVSWTPSSEKSSCHSSFRLCKSNALSAPPQQGRRSEDSGSASKCGLATWPTVIKAKNGTCMAELDPPPMETEQTYVLMMESEDGSQSESPYFSLTPSRSMSPHESSGEESSSREQESDRYPANEAVPTNGTDPADETAPETYQPPKKSFAQNIPPDSDQTFLPVSPGPELVNVNAASPLSTRDVASDTAPVLLSSNGPNVIAFAVPLGLVLGIAIIAVILAVRHYRKSARQRTTDAEKLATLSLSRFSRKDSMYKAPLDLDYPANAALPGHVSGPVPLFMPVDLESVAPESRRAPRKSVPVSESYTNVSPPTVKAGRGARPLVATRESVSNS